MLSDKEKSIVLIANAIAVFLLYQESGDLQKSVSMIDFILKTIPDNMKEGVSIELIDEIFEFVSSSHSS